jgi:hypothetical protein
LPSLIRDHLRGVAWHLAGIRTPADAYAPICGYHQANGLSSESMQNCHASLIEFIVDVVSAAKDLQCRVGVTDKAGVPASEQPP